MVIKNGWEKENINIKVVKKARRRVESISA